MSDKLLAILFDSGDTLVDEATEIKDKDEVVLKAELIPGAAETIRTLKQRGYRLGLVADGPAGTFYNVLGQHGLLELFDALAISGEVGVSKPHPRMFRCALDALGIPPADYGRVLMVGNHLARDIKGANALGIVSVWLNWSPRRPKIPADPSEQPRYTVKTHAELLNLINEMERATNEHA